MTGQVIVLDNEALQALADVHHGKHRAVLAFLEATSTRNRRRVASVTVRVPTVVRVEAGVDRRAPSTASLARLRIADVPLDSTRADRAVELRRIAGSVTDACVAQVAREAAGGVTVLTDLPALCDAARVVVHRV